MKSQAVIFDCDGTLVDSEELSVEVLVEYVAELGLVLPFDEALALFPGRGMGFCIAEVERRMGRRLPSTFETALRGRTADAFRDRLRAIDGAEDTVRALRVPFCVATGGPHDKTRLTLSITGLLPYFEGRIFSSYDVGAWKPDPTLFLHAARNLGVSPAACTVVEDSPAGIEAGLAAGMNVLALRPERLGARLPRSVGILQSLRELLAVLDDPVEPS